jgi:hypothetical protein
MHLASQRAPLVSCAREPSGVAAVATSSGLLANSLLRSRGQRAAASRRGVQRCYAARALDRIAGGPDTARGRGGSAKAAERNEP